MFIPETYGKISFASKSGGTNPVAGEIDDYKYGEYAPDGNHLLVEDLRGSVDSMTGQSSNVKLTLYLCDPSGGKEVLLSQKDTKVYARFARDGQSIVYVKGRQLATMELKTRTEKVYNIPDESHGAMSPVLSLDNSRIYYLCSQKGACDVWMLNIATGTNMQITTGMRTVGAYAIEGKSLTPLPDHLDISPDGLFLAVSARVGITGDVADQLVTKDGNPTMPAYHDSSLGNIWLLTVDGKVKKQITNGDHDQRPRFSPDGKQLAFQRKVKPQPGQQQISFGGEPVGLWRVMLIDLGR
jgi:Tol biopolymer transport system component